MGSAAAQHLSARGVRVLGLERHTPVHDLGSSHGGSRVVRQAYFEDPAYVPLLLRAYELWETLNTHADVFRVTGGVFMGPPDSLTVAGALRAAQEWGLAHELLDAPELRRRFPTMTPAPEEVGVYEALAGFARPEATIEAQLRLAAAQGAELHFTEPVLDWESTPDGGVRVRTAAATYTAGALVLCPGAWAPQLLADLGVPITVERQVMHWFDPPAGVAAFADNPVYVHEEAGGDPENQIYGFPAYEGPAGGVKVAFFRRGQACTPETIDRTVSTDRGRRHAGSGGPDHARDGRYGNAPGHLHVLHDARPPLRRGPAPCARRGHRGLRLLRARLQVRARHRRNPG